MPTDLITIGRSGLAASRAALDITAQNIANASNEDYVRRRMNQSELVGTGKIDRLSLSKLSGVRIGTVDRADSQFAQRRLRVSTSDLERVTAEISGLKDAETALEKSGLYRALIGFESALTLMESDPTDPALRNGAIEGARQLVETFHFADFSLDNARGFAEAEVAAGLAEVNGAAQELARINVDLVGSQEGTAGRAALLDARDAALGKMAQQVGIEVEFDRFGGAIVRMDAPGAPLLVSGNTAETLTSTTAANGTVSFAIGATSVSPGSGALAGRASALGTIATQRSELDSLAALTITQINNAQANGVGLDGTTGQPVFSGSDAASIELALQDGAGLALAPAGSPAGSRETANLRDMIAVFSSDSGPVVGADRLLLSLSSRIAGLDTTREGLEIIHDSAKAELLAKTGVDLDTEAANLVRLQQAFEANSRVIQIAANLFDTLLGLAR